MASALKHADPDNREGIVLMRALRDTSLPPCVSEDAPLFMGIIHDLSPALELPTQSYPDVHKAVEDVPARQHYVVTEKRVRPPEWRSCMTPCSLATQHW